MDCLGGRESGFFDGFEIYLVDVKTMGMIAHIFVAFSEKLNFTNPESIDIIFSSQIKTSMLEFRIKLTEIASFLKNL